VLILGHGATDAFFGTDPEGYRMAMAVVVQALRGAGGPQMPVAQALLGPLEARRGEREALLTRLGLAGVALQTRDPVLHAAMIRESQVLFAREVSLASGGDLSRVALGADGVHWSRDGVIQAARIVAEALAAELR
jgi:hypothetical protein